MDNIGLQVMDLSKSYGSFRAVDHISFTVRQGDVFGFLGPNGAGKSTTIRMILSLIRPDSGDILINGFSVLRERNKALRHMGALVEEPAFYKHLSARKNLELLARMEGIPFTRIDTVLDNVSLLDRADDKVKAFSHGMKQRLGIAQALLNKPEILVLDEPTSGLDPEHMKEVRDLIRDLSGQGMTIFLSSHLLYEVEKVCTSMAIVNHGKLVITGSVSELLGAESDIKLEIVADPVNKAQKVLQGLEFVREISTTGTTLFCTTTKPHLPAINATLVDRDIAVMSFNPRTSLEDYYLSMTGEQEK
ncbi:MAG: ABC transporter ATP-binding protein [Fidelibacterota bacterium]